MTYRENNIDKNRSHALKLAVMALIVVLAMAGLSSCGLMHQVFSKKTMVTFDSNGGAITGKDVKGDIEDAGVSDEGASDEEAEDALDSDDTDGAEGTEDADDMEDGESQVSSGDRNLVYTHKCIVGDPVPDIKGEKEYYKFKGWYTEREGGIKVAVISEDIGTLYAQYKSANKDRGVEISDIQTGKKGNRVRISQNEEENKIKITFRVSEYYGQKLAFTNRKGKVTEEIEPDPGTGFAPDGLEISAYLPDRNWMDHKATTYYIKSFGNDHVDEGEPVKFKVTLAGQYKYFDQPIEGSMAWYGGDGETHPSRSGVIIATDDEHVYTRHESTNETEDGSIIYKWKKKDVMINLADVRTDIVYDIYNAYSSRFFPIKGKAMYMDNGKKGLKRYEPISKESAMHPNSKTGKTTFMVPVQWDFAEKIALAQSRARDAGYTLYIADTFRPMNSVGPVAKEVDNASLLAYGGTSAHNFGMAVDTGWQRVDQNGEPTGAPYVKNLQSLKKKLAVKGPNGNEREIWWQGVSKLPQEWWHYGDTNLNAKYREHAKRVGSLYVNLGECISEKRSKL